MFLSLTSSLSKINQLKKSVVLGKIESSNSRGGPGMVLPQEVVYSTTFFSFFWGT